MKIAHPLRTAVALAALAAAPAAHAESGVTSSGWYSMIGVVVIVGVLYWVYKKLG